MSRWFPCPNLSALLSTALLSTAPNGAPECGHLPIKSPFNPNFIQMMQAVLMNVYIALLEDDVNVKLAARLMQNVW